MILTSKTKQLLWLLASIMVALSLVFSASAYTSVLAEEAPEEEPATEEVVEESVEEEAEEPAEEAVEEESSEEESSEEGDSNEEDGEVLGVETQATVQTIQAKVDVCHSEGNAPYQLLNIAIPAWENGHESQHEDDFLVDDNNPCPIGDQPNPVDDDDDGDNATLQVCKVIIDSEGNIVDGSEADGEFDIHIEGPNDYSTTVSFETTLSLNEDLLDDNGGDDDAECFELTGLDAGKYTYDAEDISGSSDWGTELYHDYFNETPSEVSDFYELTEDGEPGDEDNADGVINLGKNKTRKLVVINTYRPEEDTAKIIAHKIVCDDESYLPNWAADGSAPFITADTAADFLAEGDNDEHCWLASDWDFQWAPQGTSIDFTGDSNTGDLGDPWETFGSTDEDGMTMVSVPLTGKEDFVWIKEVWNDDYIPFTGQTTSEDVSAEIHCHTDGLNYDNFERVDGIEEGETYYCVAFNVPVEPPPYGPYCGDGIVNQEWEECDGGEQCTDQCLYGEQCVDAAFARVNVSDVKNWGNGDMTSDIFLGGNPIPAGTWFPIYWNGLFITDPDISGYEDVPGLAVERQDGQIRAVAHGTWKPNPKAENPTGNAHAEHISGDIEFWNILPASQSSDDSGNNKLEKGFNGTMTLSPGNDEVWLDGDSSHFWLTTDTADDGFFTEYGEAPEQCVEMCTEEHSMWGYEIESFDQGLRKNGTAVVAERSDENEALGEAEDNDTINFASLGFGGEIVVKFEAPFPNGSGDDIQIFETSFGNPSYDSYPEDAEVWISQDGSVWHKLGDVQTNGGSFDMDGILDWAQYVKLIDTTDSSEHNGNADGFDLDAIKVLHCGPADNGGGGPDPEEPDPEVPPTVDLDVNGQESEITITEGDNVTLEWFVTDADTCTASLDWGGDKSASDDSENQGALPAGSYSFAIECTNEDGSDSDSVTVTVEGDSGSNGGGGPSSGSNGGGGSGGSVLGAFTGPGEVLGASCGLYLNEFMHIDSPNNDSWEVMKLQMFLNSFIGSNLPINGIFGEATETAVRRFQTAHNANALSPWSLIQPTGYVYKTTKWTINNLMCPDLGLPMPGPLNPDTNISDQQ